MKHMGKHSSPYEAVDSLRGCYYCRVAFGCCYLSLGLAAYSSVNAYRWQFYLLREDLFSA